MNGFRPMWSGNGAVIIRLVQVVGHVRLAIIVVIWVHIVQDPIIVVVLVHIIGLPIIIIVVLKVDGASVVINVINDLSYNGQACGGEFR
ncbi:hypothetical protein F5883DRAFT_537755 [Diaporthe sp. PMI_573]|nr:hypothetical protein F5883DRAFT_537755 [Diaporthaceae sp. PMI_573]